MDKWTVTDLEMLTRRELSDIAKKMDPYCDPANATKADLVAFIVDADQDYPSVTVDDSPEAMLREAAQLAAWVRGVPPPEACLTAADKRWIKQYSILETD